MRAGTRRILTISGLVVFAVALAFVESVQDHLASAGFRGRDPFGFRLAHMLPPWLIVAALAPAIVAFVRRRPLAFEARALLSHGLAAALFAVAHMTLLAAIDSFRPGARPIATTIRVLLGFHFVFDLLLYLAIAGAVQALESARALRKREADALKLEASLLEARLAALRSQLNPHFLFNVLNTAAMLAREGRSEDTVAVLARLSELLRYVLREGRSGMATLGDELQFLRGYLELEQAARHRATPWGGTDRDSRPARWVEDPPRGMRRRAGPSCCCGGGGNRRAQHARATPAPVRSGGGASPRDRPRRRHVRCRDPALGGAGMTAIRALVADDEPLARAGMARLVRATAGFEVAGEARDGEEAISAIEALRPDLVLLDVQMPGRDGFEVIRAVGPARMPRVVFVTAYDAFAVRAFEVEALDYVLKPFEDRRLREALGRAARATPSELARRLEALVVRSEPRFEVRLGKRIQLLSCAEIDWVEGASYYTVLHAGSETHLVREPLRDIEARLDPTRFARVHRSSIVQLDRVRELRPAECALVLRDGTRVQASRTRWPRLLEALRGIA